MENKISVIGSGSWGTALTIHFAKLGYNVMQWVREDDIIKSINEKKVNKLYLPHFEYPKNIVCSNDLTEISDYSDIIVNTVPVQYIINVYSQFAEKFKNKKIVNASKGININPLELVSDIFQKIFPNSKNKYFYLSGPSFAKEVAAEKITSISLAGTDENTLVELQEKFSNHYFRVYRVKDITGVQLGGALKNVIAIAAGISDGLELGNNARAALITRGLFEMTRLGITMGAKQQTFYGLSGLGDLVLTCSSDLSRNKTVGWKLSQGFSLNNILSSTFHVPEGVSTVKALYYLGQKLNIDLPISKKIYEILYNGLKPEAALSELMHRELKKETYNFK